MKVIFSQLEGRGGTTATGPRMPQLSARREGGGGGGPVLRRRWRSRTRGNWGAGCRCSQEAAHSSSRTVTIPPLPRPARGPRFRGKGAEGRGQGARGKEDGRRRVCGGELHHCADAGVAPAAVCEEQALEVGEAGQGIV